MTSFFITLVKFATAFRQGMKDHEFRALFILLISLLVSSSIFYGAVEGWGVVDSVYFSIMTLSTVGYGDLHPTTDLSKIFTVFYLIMGGGVFVGFVTKVAAQRPSHHFHRHDEEVEK